MTMTRDLAVAASNDAVDARMRKAGRTVWSRTDYNHQVRVFDQIWPLEMDYPWMGAGHTEALVKHFPSRLQVA